MGEKTRRAERRGNNTQCSANSYILQKYIRFEVKCMHFIVIVACTEPDGGKLFCVM